MSTSKTIAIPRTVEDYAAKREQAVTLLRSAQQQIAEAKALLDKEGATLFPWRAESKVDIDGIIKHVDREMWRLAIDRTGFFAIMDEEAITAFNRDCHKRCVPFTLEYIRGTFSAAMEDADMMFARGVVNVFQRLHPGYRTNSKEPFKIDRKAIIEGCLNPQMPTLEIDRGTGVRARICDIDRVFKVLDGQPYQPRSLELALNRAWADGDNLYEDNFYRIRGYKNGNLHIEFLRSDLLDRVNKVISEFYEGRALGCVDWRRRP